MEKIKYGRFPYNLLKPAENNRNGFAAILYHGWGTTADSYTGLAEEIAEKGYIVIIPEIVYHDSRNPLTNWFDKKVTRKYFWKTIVESIEEFEAFFQGLGIAKEKTLLIGSSMGGFIANGIFSFQKDLGGLVNINGSGSFVLTEKLFRERDGRPALTAEEEAFLSQFDPVQKEKCASPVLLMHGDQDTTIPIAGQERYFQHLKEKEGRENAKFLIFPGVNHQITEAVVERLLNWLEEVQKMQVWRAEMTKELAVEILNWRYAEPYDFYNDDVTEEGLQELLDGSYSALVEETGKLIGFFCTGSSAQVPIGNEAEAYNEPRLDIGIGMNPELTGKGNGFRFFSQILELAEEEGNGLQLRLTVAAFNERAIHLYEKLGFVKEREFSTNSTKFITMVKGDI